MGTSTPPPSLSEDIPVATWVGELSAYWCEDFLSLSVEYGSANGTWVGVCRSPTGTHPHPRVRCPVSEYCMTPGNGEDMTACFGAWNVKTTPKRAFSSCPNRPHRVASVYCQRRVDGGGVEQSHLASAPSMVSIEREKISNCGGENDPRGHELRCARYPLSRRGKCFMCCSERFSSYLQSQNNLCSHEG